MVRVRTTGRGGPRGGGRPPKPESEVRRNRVVVMLTDQEFETLLKLAKEKKLPFGTAAYQIMGRSLARKK